MTQLRRLALLLPKFAKNCQNRLFFTQKTNKKKEDTYEKERSNTPAMKRLLPQLMMSSLLWMSLDANANNNPSSPASILYVNQLIGAVTAGIQGLQAQINAMITYSPGEGIVINQGVIQSTFVRHIGERYQGGIVFYVEPGGLHGLVAADVDASEGISWQNGEAGEGIVNAKGNGLFAGDSNTRLIIAQQTIDDQTGNFAALVAASFTKDDSGANRCLSNCYGGWYLPSLYELRLMYTNLAQSGRGDFAQSLYWSSTESSVTHAFAVNFSTGEKGLQYKSDETIRVRPIRAF